MSGPEHVELERAEAIGKRGTMAGTAERLSRQAREQTARAGTYLARNAQEYPLEAVLIAGLIGYGLGFLIHRNWSRETGPVSRRCESIQTRGPPPPWVIPATYSALRCSAVSSRSALGFRAPPWLPIINKMVLMQPAIDSCASMRSARHMLLFRGIRVIGNERKDGADGH